MGKLNEIQKQMTQSYGDNAFTTTIKDDTVEFDSLKDKFTFKDEVEVPSLKVGGEPITPVEPQVQADWNQYDSSATDYIKNKPVDNSNNVKLGSGSPSISGSSNVIIGTQNSSISGTNDSKCVAIGGAISVSTASVQGAVRLGGYGGDGQAILNSSGSFAIGGSGMGTVGNSSSSANSSGSGFIGHCGYNSKIEDSAHSIVIGGADNVNITAGSEQCVINSICNISSTGTHNTIIGTGGFNSSISGNSGSSAILGGSGNNMNGSSFSVILGGMNHTMTGCYNSVILGGSNITATENETAYMKNANMSGVITLGTLKLKDDSGVLKVSDDGGTTWKTVTLS